ncbi:16S rRNA (cytosine(967)-C(5))-methyltransferase [Hassallia byssoidea VB512170]|uniref:16S rRNA (cytosine(967)-C(5))-methyltransferase n=1 Tax=Hassallia byssoidea VB512170 TaxID=1304833 RepID=A0A846HFF3_9CYAN|nr:16S rRNA (cytosine(967)-C(5))-methyltransferase [Hassalia byssoidea]NEU75181.1 16S rRNA (cytosine(967)-C(5))-methyltransferase [Hassalia byssoidea VB512170]
MINPRQLAFIALREVHKGAYADVALDRVLQKVKLSDASGGLLYETLRERQRQYNEELSDRRLVTDLVYGCTRRQRTLDAIIDQLGKKKSHQQPAYLRTILHLGLYQLRYLERIPPSAAVNTTVQLAKENGFSGLTGFVNGLLREYIRRGEGEGERGGEGGRRQGAGGRGQGEFISPSPSSPSSLPSPHFPLQLPENPVERLGILHSFPDWIIEVWLKQFGFAETEKLCEWMNQTPVIDLRVNLLRASVDEVETALQLKGVLVKRVSHLPQALRLIGSTGAIQNLPGFSEGWWTVQDSSAQLVSHLLDPQPGEVIIDACAAPGGKTTHIAELMQDKGTIWAGDRTTSRLRKLKENAQRLNLHSIQIYTGDSRNQPQFKNIGDRVLLDAPCSGLGTLHRHADARWRQTPESVQELSALQKELIAHTSTFVKTNGILVYATCTLHPAENEDVIESFLASHSNWQIEPPDVDSPAATYSTPQGWIKVLPHKQEMDGFFMVRLRKTND